MEVDKDPVHSEIVYVEKDETRNLIIMYSIGGFVILIIASMIIFFASRNPEITKTLGSNLGKRWIDSAARSTQLRYSSQKSTNKYGFFTSIIGAVVCIIVAILLTVIFLKRPDTFKRNSTSGQETVVVNE